LKIYGKFLLISLPLVLLALIAGAGSTYYLSSQALGKLAGNWLETRLEEAIRVISENENFLQRYEISDIVSGVKKAKLDAVENLQRIKVGEKGFIFVVSGDGLVVSYPHIDLLGNDVAGEAWFADIARQGSGQLKYTWNSQRSLAVFTYFEPWDWYVVVSNPLSEVYGAITKTRTSVLLLAVGCSIVLCFMMALLARRIVSPLHRMVEGAQQVGLGKLRTRIDVVSNDELGELSVAFNDMTEKLQQSHGELKRSEQHFRALIENESGIIVVVDDAGIVRYVSPSLRRVLNYRVGELLGRNLAEMVHDDDLTLFEQFFEQVLNVPGQEKTEEFRLQHADGDWRVFEVFSQNLLADETVCGIVFNARDITVRKRFENALRESEKQLHALMSQLLQAQEVERKRLSAELHDVVGQNLLFLKLRITQLESCPDAASSKSASLCSETLLYIDQMIENIRRLCWDLLPSDLEDLGLTTAIESLVGDCARHCDLEISTELDLIDDLFNQEAQVIIYRLVQESLTNIAKHANAATARVSGLLEDEVLCFSIDDDGVGFDVEDVLARDANNRGIGLSAMRERVRIINADLQFHSHPGVGTRISFSIPLDIGEKG
jgi:PAS domain S-box-containing protein